SRAAAQPRLDRPHGLAADQRDGMRTLGRACAGGDSVRDVAVALRRLVDPAAAAVRRSHHDEGARRMPMTVFVTDGDQRPALAIVRALGRRGLRVLVGSDGPSSLASCSKYCAGHVPYPSPLREGRAFARFLTDFVARERVDVLMPVTDVTTHAVCADQERLERRCALAVPPFPAFELVTNKARLLQYAAARGIAVPRTHLVANASRLREGIDAVTYPAVAKPVQSRLPTDDGWQSGGVHYASSRAELEQIYRDDDVLARRPSLVQQRIVGPGVGVFVLFDRGTLVADFAHRRLREKPP